mmetsp:Transcript_4363/g.6575  ORF Transcript_4363/g.6575 Transcript_4363/m.6575 type:complete len:425 (+) Transcript_4363:6-1280(+)
MEPECSERCQIVARCECRDLLCDHNISNHVRKGHVIYPVAQKVELTTVLDIISKRKEEVLELSLSIISEVEKMTAHQLNQLEKLRQKAAELETIERVKEESDDVRPSLENLEAINQLVEKLNTQRPKPVVVSANSDNNIRIWKNGQAKILEGHTQEVTSVAVSHGKEFIVSGSLDKTVRVWSISTRKQIQVLEGHTQRIWCVDISKEDKFVVSGGDGGTIIVWNLASGEKNLVTEGHRGSVKCVVFSKKDEFILSAGRDGTIKKWSLALEQQNLMPNGNYGEILSLAISSKDEFIAFGSKNNPIWVYNIGSRNLTSLKNSHCEFSSLAISKNDKFLVSLSFTGSQNLIVWDLTQNKTTQDISIRCSQIIASSIDLSIDNKQVVFGLCDVSGNGSNIGIYDLETGKQVEALKNNNKAQTWSVKFI